MRILTTVVFWTTLAATCFAAQEKLLTDFEEENDIKFWEIKNKSASISDQHATHGKKSLKIASTEHLFWYRVPKDWSAFDSLDIDIFVDGNDPVAGNLLIGDQAWQDKGRTYWNRHNGTFNLTPGQNTVSIPVNGLFRGEAGSRNSDIKENIDPKQITRFDIGFESKTTMTLYLDNVRFVKESRPDGILAFDFGPQSQTVFPGFTPISWNTVHGQNGAKAGLKRSQWGANAAKDDTFPTRLYQDCVNLDGNEFIADVPNGKYKVSVVYNDSGYWGGEQARFTKRWIDAEDKRVFSEERTDGAADYLFRFENVEPKPGDSIWDLYMKDTFAAHKFDVTVSDGALNLRFNSEGQLGGKVAAIIIYPDNADAAKWVSEIEEKNKKEFEARALFLGPKPKELTPPADAAIQNGLWLGFPDIETSVSFYDAPSGNKAELSRVAAKGQRLSYTFCVNQNKLPDAEVKLTVSDLKGPTGAIAASDIDVRYVHNLTHRSYNNIAYTISPESLRRVEGSGLKLSGKLTRQFWITVHVPESAKAGVYKGEVTLNAGAEAKIPLSLDVQDLALDEPDFMMGFYGSHIPEGLSEERRKTAYKEMFTLLKENGMNSISGGPGIQLKGFDSDNKPQLDFRACDDFMRIMKECGFTKPPVAYGGPGQVHGLCDGYVIGETGKSWEKKLNKPFGEILKIVYAAVKEHAEKEGWPKIYYEFVDEPRVVETAQAQNELLKVFADYAPWVHTGGSYSVEWNEKPVEKAIQETFKLLKWSALNLHTQTDLDKAKEFGRELQIYNQGTTRFSFGAYQWAEYKKGITGRMQWHLLALHGYQFFDLDGREPDTAMINWGRKELLPTIHLPRCREGADDFRFAVTLWNLAQKNKDSAAAKEAIKWLEEVNQAIGIGQRERPKGFMDDETFRNKCVELIKKIKG